MGDAVYRSLRDPAPPTMYWPLAQMRQPPSGVTLTVRAAGSPALLARSVGAAVTGVNRHLTLTFRPLADQVNASLTQERLVAKLSGFFGALALLLAALGDKSRAKELARKVNVPVLPGWSGDDQRDESFAEAAARVGYPVMVKPVAGGGGIGLQTVMNGMLAAGIPPDTFQSLSGAAVKQYVDGNYLDPVDDVWTAAKLDENYPAVIGKMTVFNGKHYAIPMLAHRANWLFYNVKLFKELNLTPPANADELIAVAKTIKEQRPDVAPIGLGSRDRVKPGMTFAVYSRYRGIPSDGKGKATLEVIHVFDTTSECKITSRTPAEPILEGDYIANPVFDKDHQFTFVVAGDFDLNFDGKVEDPKGREVTRLVEAWGGKIGDKSLKPGRYVLRIQPAGSAPAKPPLPFEILR